MPMTWMIRYTHKSDPKLRFRFLFCFVVTTRINAGTFQRKFSHVRRHSCPKYALTSQPELFVLRRYHRHVLRRWGHWGWYIVALGVAVAVAGHQGQKRASVVSSGWRRKKETPQQPETLEQRWPNLGLPPKGLKRRRLEVLERPTLGSHFGTASKIEVQI